MNIPTYTPEQQALLDHVTRKLRVFFEASPVKAHNFDHAEQVASNAKIIALAEGARSPFLCELAGWLHDIGRVPEAYDETKTGITHHELSYELLKSWFSEDAAFGLLVTEEKRELLYSLRYHWNNGADAYDTAWILRDADKLDALGQRGLDRSLEVYGHDEHKLLLDVRLRFDLLHWLKTKTARDMAETQDMIRPIEEWYLAKLRTKVEDIEV